MQTNTKLFEEEMNLLTHFRLKKIKAQIESPDIYPVVGNLVHIFLLERNSHKGEC